MSSVALLSPAEFFVSRERESLQFEISVNENGQFAALDVTVYALDTLLFVGWMCETAYKYIEFVAASRGGPYSNDPAVRQFEQIVRRARLKGWSRVSYGKDGEIYYSQLRKIQQKTLSPGGIAASSDILRFEFISFEKVNPSRFTIKVAGTVVALALVTSTVGAIMIMEESNAGECRQQFAEVAKQQTSGLMELSRREGRWTDVHQRTFEQIQDAYKVNVLTCGAALKSTVASVEQTPGGAKVGLGLEAGHYRNIQKKMK